MNSLRHTSDTLIWQRRTGRKAVMCMLCIVCMYNHTMYVGGLTLDVQLCR